MPSPNGRPVSYDRLLSARIGNPERGAGKLLERVPTAHGRLATGHASGWDYTANRVKFTPFMSTDVQNRLATRKV